MLGSTGVKGTPAAPARPNRVALVAPAPPDTRRGPRNARVVQDLGRPTEAPRPDACGSEPGAPTTGPRHTRAPRISGGTKPKNRASAPGATF